MENEGALMRRALGFPTIFRVLFSRGAPEVPQKRLFGAMPLGGNERT